MMFLLMHKTKDHLKVSVKELNMFHNYEIEKIAQLQVFSGGTTRYKYYNVLFDCSARENQCVKPVK